MLCFCLVFLEKKTFTGNFWFFFKMKALQRCSRALPQRSFVRFLNVGHESPREKTLVPAQRKGIDYAQAPGLRSDAIDKAYEGSVDTLDTFMSKAFPSGPRNSAEWAIMQIDKVTFFFECGKEEHRQDY